MGGVPSSTTDVTHKAPQLGAGHSSLAVGQFVVSVNGQYLPITFAEPALVCSSVGVSPYSAGGWWWGQVGWDEVPEQAGAGWG